MSRSFEKTKRGVAIWPSQSTPRCTSESNGNVCPHTHCYTNVRSGVIHSGQKMERTPMSIISWRLNKQSLIYSHIMECHSSTRKKEVRWMLQHRWTLKSLCYMVEARHNRPQNVRFHICDMSRRGKSMETESRWVAGWGWRRGSGGKGDC